jgi:hypothetical protein
MSVISTWETVQIRRVGSNLHLLRAGDFTYEVLTPAEWKPFEYVGGPVGFGKPVAEKKPVLKFDYKRFRGHLTSETSLSYSTICALSDAIETHLKIELE